MGRTRVDATDLHQAMAGDDAAFARLVAPLRPELHAHCYRMLGSVHDADDALQDAFVRAWRGLGRFEGRSSLRSWLYALTTHSCLDAARGRSRRALPVDLGPASERVVVDAAPRTDVAWIGPHPDERYEQREAVELAFLAALQRLPGNQRAALLLFDVLGYAVAEIAELLATTPSAVASALQRARAATAGGAPAPRTPDRHQRSVVASFGAAMEQGDVDALVALLAADVTWSMPPLAQWYRGRAAVAEFARAVPLGGGCGAWRSRPTTANHRPALAFYRDEGEDAPTAWSITAFAVHDGLITEITTFIGAEHFPVFGLPAALRPDP